MQTTTQGRVLAAQALAGRIRPRIGGFPYLAEALRQAGVTRYHFDVASMTGVFVTDTGCVLQPGPALATTELIDINYFNEAALIAALRTDQAGQSTFPEFARATFDAGVFRYEVDLLERTCTYHAPDGAHYLEQYIAVDLPADSTNT
jgi:uncharacterized protein YbcV (DUF1398 family)